MFMRILSLNVQPGKFEEFQEIYSKEIVPALKSIKACCYMYLTGSVDNPNEAISITIWNSREAAEKYEKEMFVDLLEKAEHTLSNLYQWKMALEREKGWNLHTSDDLSVQHYSVISGKSFQKE